MKRKAFLLDLIQMVLEIIGLVFIVVGCFLIWTPLGCIAIGVIVLRLAKVVRE